MVEVPGAEPDSTAVRVALWRAMHVQVDALPHVLDDEIGLRLAEPDAGWRERGTPMALAGSGRASSPGPALWRTW